MSRFIQPPANSGDPDRAAREEIAFLQAVTEAIPGTFFVFDRDGYFVRWNEAAREIIGVSEEEMRKIRVFDIISPEDRPMVASKIEQAFATGRAETEARVLQTGGEVRWRFMTGTRIDIGGASYLVATGLDTTKRRQAEEALRESEAKLQAILDSCPLPIAWTDESGGVEYINRKVTELFGYTLEDLPTVESWYEAAYPDEAYRSAVMNAWAGAIDAAKRSGKPIPGFEATIVCKDGTRREVSIAGSLINGRQLVIFTDLTERKALERELEHQAQTDFLTGIPNRRYFLEMADVELARARRYRRPFSLLMLDLDLFKDINDRHGHRVGDLMLQRVVEVCRQTLRGVDVIGRLGGEEFGIILPETDAQRARQVAERLRQAVRVAEVRSGVGGSVSITTSVGVATFTDDDDDVGTVLNRADQALYDAKRAGRDQVRTESDPAVPVRNGTRR